MSSAQSRWGWLEWRLMLWLFLLALVIGSGVFIAQKEQPILQTNLLALLPKTERNPVAEVALHTLAGSAENKVFFLIGADTSEGAVHAARHFAHQLQQSSDFAYVLVDVPSSGLSFMKDWFVQHRFQLGFDGAKTEQPDAGAWISEALQARFLSPMMGPAALVGVEQDPLGYAQAWFDRLPTRAVRLLPQHGVLLTEAQGRTWVFVQAGLKGSIYEQDTAEQALKRIVQAEQSLIDAQVLKVGAVFHAEKARSKAQADVDLIGAGSLFGMLLMLYWVFRSIRPLLAAVVSVGFGVAWAAVICVWAYGHLHLITLVFGASLIGEAVDYSIQYFSARLEAKSNWDALACLRRMTPGLSVALGTSLLGYGALWFSPFEALSQIALFAMVGLFAAWLSVMLFLPWFLKHPVRKEATWRALWVERWLLWWKTRMTVKQGVWLSVVLFLCFGLGVSRLKGQDDVKLLIAPDPGLVQQEEQFKTLAGVGNSSQFFLVQGRSVEELLQREEVLVGRLKPLLDQGQLRAYQAISTFVPALSTQTNNIQWWAQRVFSTQVPLAAVFDQMGLEPAVERTWRTDFQRSQTQRVALSTWLEAPLSMPWRHLWIGKTEQGYASMVIPDGLSPAVQVSGLIRGVQGVVWVDKPASISALFQEYRRYSAVWLLLAVGAIGLGLALHYGRRNAVALMLPTLLALSIALGAYGWLGLSINLFNMMALMLVLGVGVNYSIFLREGGSRSTITFVGVLLSAGTTLLAFGLLAFSSMPVLAGFGLMLTVGIASAVLLSPLSLVFAPQQGEG